MSTVKYTANTYEYNMWKHNKMWKRMYQNYTIHLCLYLQQNYLHESQQDLLHNGCIILTNSTGQNPSLDGTSFSASQKFSTYIILINSFYLQYYPPMHINIHNNPINTEQKWTRKYII